MRARGAAAAVLALVLAACGTILAVTGEETPPTHAPLPPADAEAGVDAAPDVDAGKDAALDADDGGLAPAEAGSIACGDRTCESSQQFCCYDGGAPSCDMIVTDPCNFAVYCDEPADCTLGMPCALFPGDSQTSCAPSVVDDAGYPCGTDDDCPSMKCVVTTCRGIRMRLCDGYCPP